MVCMCAVAAAVAALLLKESGAAATARATSLIFVQGPRTVPQSRGETLVKRSVHEADSLTCQSVVLSVSSEKRSAREPPRTTEESSTSRRDARRPSATERGMR